jgi:hypothetical protein
MHDGIGREHVILTLHRTFRRVTLILRLTLFVATGDSVNSSSLGL